LACLSGFVLARADPALAPNLKVVPPVLLATGAAVATTLLDLPVLASVAVAAAVYLVVLLALKAVPEELLELMPASLRRR
jgi:hypothetical protein